MRDYIQNDWYIAAYEPIKNINFNSIGILHVGVLEQKFLDSRDAITGTFVTITVIVSIITVLLSYFISRRIVSPINDLASAAENVAQGEFDTRVAYTSNDELGDLAETFNLMAEKLRRRDDKIKEFTKSRIMQSERLALVGQLSANVAHELNNPLTAIIGIAQLLQSGELSEGVKQDLEKLVGEAHRAGKIVRSLLDFSRQQRPERSPVFVEEVLDSTRKILAYIRTGES